MEDWYTVLRTGIPRSGAAGEEGDLRRALARRPADRRLRGLGLRRRPGDQARRRLQAVRRPRRPRHPLALGGGAGAAAARLGAVDRSSATGAAPYVNVPPLTPETIQVPNVFGVGAFHDPQGTDLLRELPHTPNIDFSQRRAVLPRRRPLRQRGARASATSRSPTRSRSRASSTTTRRRSRSCARASARWSAGRWSTRTSRRPPTARWRCPRSRRRRCTPGQATATVGADGGEIPAQRRRAQPYTSRESEVSDLRQLARTHVRGARQLHRAVLPDPDPHRRRRRRAGDRSGSLAALQHDGVAQRPALLIQAGDSRRQHGRRRGPAARRRSRRTSSS